MGLFGALKVILMGVLAAGLVIAVIVLGVEVAKLKQELDDIQAGETTTGVPVTTTEDPSLLDPWDRDYRLPETLQTEHYDLMLHPNFLVAEGVEPTFSGSVTLTFKLEAPQEFLAIHQRGLNVTEPLLMSGANSVELERSLNAPRNEFFVMIPANKPLPAGEYKLSLVFTGSLNQSELVGMYTSQYKDGNGDTQKLVTSKFEPTYARRAFPCMDEPDKKATYTVSLVRNSASPWIALSNMNENTVSENDPEPGLATVHFNPSVKMSTYLACFIVCQFEYLEEQVTDGPLVRTYAPPHVKDNTRFALDAAKDITAFYIEYFDIPYPMPKLDLIAIPDFVSGAMEHWGLITFRETNMIVDDAKSSSANRQQVGQVVAHELAHMWFGNLVTMKWWEDLWLNEGFASFTEYKGLHSHRPDMEVMSQFVTQDLQPVLALDAQLSSHPVIQPVAHPDQITELFDTITYSKGSAVLRMLENFLGDNVFKAGVSKYLKAFEYDNAETKDLWAKLQEAATEAGQDVDVPHVMDTWTLQMGLPVVSVKLSQGKATLSQSRFLATPPENPIRAEESPYGYRWDIPITWTFKDNTETDKLAWLKMDDTEVEISVDAASPWVKLNRDQMGFYRVNYEPEVWQELIKAYAQLDPALSALDRSSLLDDAFNLAEATLLEYSVALEMADAMAVETAYIPWVTAAARFSTISPLVRGKIAYAKYRTFLQAGVQTIYADVTWTVAPEDGHVRKRLRATVLNHACSAGLEGCLVEAGRQFQNWLDDPVANAIGVDLRQLVYTFGMEQLGTEAVWRTVWSRYMAEQDAQERSKLLLSLAAIKDAAILQMFVLLAESEENVRGQDYFTVLQNIADNPIGTPIVWDYVRSNWEKLVARFTLNNRYLGRMIPRITQNFDTELKLQEMEAFFAEYPEAGAGAASRAQALERVRNNIKWVALHYPAIADWLDKWTPSTH